MPKYYPGDAVEIIGQDVTVPNLITAGNVDGVDVSALDAAVVKKALFNAQTMLAAVNDNDPAPLTVAASRFVGRKASGNIAAMTGAEAMAVLSGQVAAGFSFNSQEITSAKLNALVLKGTFTADGTVVLPSFTLGGRLFANLEKIVNVEELQFGSSSVRGYLSGQITFANQGIALVLIVNHRHAGRSGLRTRSSGFRVKPPVPIDICLDLALAVHHRRRENLLLSRVAIELFIRQPHRVFRGLTIFRQLVRHHSSAGSRFMRQIGKIRRVLLNQRLHAGLNPGVLDLLHDG